MSVTVAASWRRMAASIRRGPVLWLILCGVMLVAAITIGTAAMIGEFRERALNNSERELENTVLLLTRHFDQQFEDSDIIARNLIAEMHFSDIASPETFKSQMSSPEAHLMLKSRVSVLSYVGDILIFDSDGNLINSSGAWPLPPFNVADRAYFRYHQTHSDRQSYVSSVIRSRISETCGMPRRLSVCQRHGT